MRIKIRNKEYDLPELPRATEYRYAEEEFCQCGVEGADADFYANTLKGWQFDGIHRSSRGDLICFTCPTCGDKFSFPCYYASWKLFGFFDKYEVI